MYHRKLKSKEMYYAFTEIERRLRFLKDQSSEEKPSNTSLRSSRAISTHPSTHPRTHLPTYLPTTTYSLTSTHPPTPLFFWEGSGTVGCFVVEPRERFSSIELAHNKAWMREDNSRFDWQWPTGRSTMGAMQRQSPVCI